MSQRPITALLQKLASHCEETDYDVFFHLRELALDLERHWQELCSLAEPGANAPDRNAILAGVKGIHDRLTNETLPHWTYHLAELDKELRKARRKTRKKSQAPS